ncbi:MAG: PorT family protein [Gemmatimonadaceae bacterium]|nr:PorT family protein [Gemmatimonadaceae bacterium]MCW5827465.1 PorT family protein [Gemmatimonadaceae bacterium]
MTLSIPIPELHRTARKVTVSVHPVGRADVVPEAAALARGAEANIWLTLVVPADAPSGIYDAADVVFRGDHGATTTVPILLRIPRADAEAAVEMAEQDACTRPKGLTTATRWFAGVESGGGLSFLAGQTAGFDEGRAAATFGTFVERTMAERWSVRTGVSFVQRGGQSAAGVTTVVLAMNRIELPLLARYELAQRLPMLPSVVPVVYGGPVVAFMLDCDVRLSVGSTSESESCDGGFGAPRTWDAGMILGAGGVMALGRTQFEFGARFVRGLASIGVPLDVRNSGWALVAGVAVPVGHVVQRSNAVAR